MYKGIILFLRKKLLPLKKINTLLARHFFIGSNDIDIRVEKKMDRDDDVLDLFENYSEDQDFNMIESVENTIGENLYGNCGENVTFRTDNIIVTNKNNNVTTNDKTMIVEEGPVTIKKAILQDHWADNDSSGGILCCETTMDNPLKKSNNYCDDEAIINNINKTQTGSNQINNATPYFIKDLISLERNNIDNVKTYIIVDMQFGLFMGRLIPQEFAYTVIHNKYFNGKSSFIRSSTYHTMIGMPTARHQLSQTERSQNIYLAKYIHGIGWNCNDYSCVKSIMSLLFDTKNKYKNSVIVTRGKQKRDFLLDCGVSYDDIATFKLPFPTNISKKAYCTNHFYLKKSLRPRCSMVNVNFIANKIMKARVNFNN